jgi:hypothetical protein
MKLGKCSTYCVTGAGCAILLATAPGVLAGPPVLPCGPEGVKRFGGYQTKLEFTPEWDAPWRLGPHADVVVAFPEPGARLIFWHGANYVPCWVNGKGRWSSDGAVVRGGAGPHQDRLCRFSFATVQETSDARVVVRWRYAPVDESGALIYADPMTRWHDWVDEFYTVYPDATGVRSVTLHSSAWDQPYAVQQSILIHQPGEQVVAATACKTETVSGGLLQWMEGEGNMPFHAMAGDAIDNAPPSSWGDWPARGSGTKTGHEFLGATQWAPCSATPTSKSWRMLIGMATGGKDRLAATRSWLAPPALQLESGACVSSGYQPDEKAYLLTATKPAAAGSVKFTLAGSASSPVVNPAFVIKGWGRAAAGLVLDGREVSPGPDFRAGHRKTAAGSDLIVWVRVNAGNPVSFDIITRD